MTKQTDDLDAVRVVTQALEPFDSKDRERIIRWSCEKLGMPAATGASPPSKRPPSSAGTPADTGAPQPGAPKPTPAPAVDIRMFIQSKNPRSDNHLAAVVAYFYHFEAPLEQQRDYITKEDLIDACRQADRKRPGRPAQVLVNTYHAGLLDKGERGQYRLNSVGENLVAMVLPESGDAPRRPRKAAPRKPAANKKKVAKKPAPKKRSPTKSKQK